MTNPFLTKPNYIRIFGHRGARGEIAENSIEGFKHTFALGIKAVEFDVVISKDKIPVLYHYFNLMPYLVKDESGNWLKNSELKVFDKSYEELSKYNIGGLDPESKHGKRFKEQKLLKNAKIPKLSELLELASRKENKDVFLNLEVKSTPFKMGLTPTPSDTVSLILKNIDTHKLEDRVIISSFDWRILYELKKQNSRILRGFITLQQDLSTTKKNIYENSPWMAKNYSLDQLFLIPNIIKSLEGHAWSVFYRDITKQNVELAHKHGLSTCVWTVNREQDIIRMIEYGVDGIITDYPKKAQEICKSKNISWF
ncbi:glycerophosphodiester phosphodiesterase family protein [Candidatus Pelagibacter bacterium]|nr:glycerophosphodiester phosphodiesterase family protein [Candidatus Pelagibacter bacterium]MDA9625124.1 glycerophosphodiester phosphodiesterase family protein [Candidatus Pelagibacter bacterium]